ncbi:hypothetical protein BBJ28_00018411 [Nothophytophthora sp. Chile5]|nr:hypothetical protein BBJ28_00018411 [Nothophytophthora sp. Chile5]
MTCAGYLLLDNSRPAFVEISTGVLVCSLAVKGGLERLHDAGESTREAAAVTPCPSEEHGLPLLEPRRMATLEVHTRRSTQKMDKIAQPEDEQPPQSMQCPVKPRQRLLQLSGFLVEVLEKEDELDAPSLPYSFQVNTFKMALRPDGSATSALQDSVILTATDEDAKRSWVKNIKHWNRYGWRETEEVCATHDDLLKLQQTLQMTEMHRHTRYSLDESLYRPQSSAMAMYGGRSSFGGQSACATRRPTRRRFYRTSIPDLFAPPS